MSSLLDNPPKAWKQSTMGKVGRYLNGYAFNSKTWCTTGRPIIRIQNLTGSGSEFNYFNGDIAPRYIVQPGDLLFSWAATLGVYVWSGPEAVLNQHIFKVESFLDKSFHRYLIEASLDEMKSRTHGTGMVHITKKKFDEIPVLIPPSDEQEEIVRVLEEQFSRLDAAAASIAAVRRKADQFRRSLLHAAFAGSLTGGKATWTTSSLEDVLDVSIGGVWGDEAGESEIDVDVVRVTELRPHGVVDVSTAVRRSVTNKQLDSRVLKIDDLLLEKSGGGPNTPVGRVGRVLKIERPTVCSNFMQLMRPNSTKVRATFLHHFLVFFHADGQTIPLQTSTTNIRNIKTKDYLKTEVPLPPIGTQDEVLEILESHLARLEMVLAEAEVLKEKMIALRRSLLHAAFNGELTKEWREKNNG